MQEWVGMHPLGAIANALSAGRSLTEEGPRDATHSLTSSLVVLLMPFVRL